MAFKRKLSRGVGTSITAVGSYTAPALTEVTVIGLIVSNVISTTIKVSVTHYDGATDTYLVKSMDIIPGGAEVVVGGDQKVVLEPNDSIRVVSDTAASADVVMSILEIA
jgi:hypothetical protein